MKALRNAGTLSVVGLIVLGLVAFILSALALTRFGGVEAAPAPSSTPVSSSVESSPAGSTDPEPSASPYPSPEPSENPGASSGTGPTVVIIGDSNSVGDEADTWVGTAADELGWGDVVNLSAPGRGYLSVPRSCDAGPCATFIDSIAAIVEAGPDVVVTFGGTADGDYSLAEPAAAYFEALRGELPDADLIAINPVTTDDTAEYWLTLHGRTIRAGVEAVDGTFVDVGQPGVGDGETLSSEAQADIAQQVVDQLS